MKIRRDSRENSYINELKILLLGDDSIKTPVMQRFSSYLFKSDSKLTIGVDFQVITIEIDGSRIKLQLWDVVSEKKVRFLFPTIVRGTNGVIFMYDLTRPSILDNIAEWLGIIRSIEGNIPIILAGVSLELEGKDHNNFSEEGLKVAKRNNLNGFIECSAKTGENVEEMFEDLARLIMQDSDVREIRPYHKRKKQISSKFEETYPSAKMKMSLLIMDEKTDFLEIRRAFFFILKLGDIDLVTCRNAKEALRIIEGRYNDISGILLDPMIPGFNKEEFLNSIKSDERYKHIIVKIVPGWEKTKESIERIISMMKNESRNELKIPRQYLPEIFDFDLLEISEKDGLPIIKRPIIVYLSSKGISTDILEGFISIKRKIEKKNNLE